VNAPHPAAVVPAAPTTREAAERDLFPPGEPLPTLPPAPVFDPDYLRERLKPRGARQQFSGSSLSAEDERRAFRQYAHARDRLRVAPPKARPLWASRVTHLREYIVRWNLPLVPYAMSILSRQLRSAPDPEQAFSDGCLGLTRAVECFDPERGYKFSTYAVRAILCQLGTCVQRANKRAARFPASELTNVHADGRAGVVQTVAGRDAVAKLRAVLATNAADLTDKERRLIQLRHLGDGATLEAVGRRMGCSKERARQVEASAFKKLRAVLAPALGED
jgi:RNA polymerase sigma factor (sigma-70 family)